MNAFQLIQSNFPSLNEAQKKAITKTEGPVQIIAGPGSGKTFVLVLRTLYLLFSGKAHPKEIVVTTFTEKASFELRDRIHQIAKQLEYKGPIHELKIGTIHGICDKFIGQFRHHTKLKNNYEVLDELTQSLFLYEHFKEIVGEPESEAFLGRWKYKWTTIEHLVPYFNKITEELINPDVLRADPDDFIRKLGEVYQRYQDKLFEMNRIDYAHQQKIFHDLLSEPQFTDRIKKDIRYIMIDEYQDTNYIQEQIILKIGLPENNICVVGDEDQSLYRFRGATVRNILEFRDHFSKCEQIDLTINYRSHQKIIESYNRFMNSINWKNPNGKIDFRFNKIIKPNSDVHFPEYPAVFSIWGISEADEAKRFATMVRFLKDRKIIEDYNQVALLLKSVMLEHSEHYIKALEDAHIPVYAPRARGYFENEEVSLILGCYSVIFGFHDEAIKDLEGSFSTLVEYTQNAIAALGPHSQLNPELTMYLRQKVKNIEDLNDGESLDLTVADYFYHLMAFQPFSRFMKNENRARNLAIFSQLLATFQDYYNINIVTYKNKKWIPRLLFNSFFKFLLDGGINEYEDPDNPIPSGYVQIMTIHQSKGLEFPVVVVGSLDKGFKVGKRVDKDLMPFYHRPVFEPEDRITEFDKMRLFYVAFSRAEKILALTTSDTPKGFLSPIWDGLNQWPYIETKVLESLKFKPKPQFVPKKSYSLTSHINVYEVCPRQYQLYQEYEFAPSRSASMFFGTVVHQTIEEIHKWVLEGKLLDINTYKIVDFFEDNYRSLVAIGMRPLSKARKETALNQVLNYFDGNREELQRVVDTEVDVSVEKDNYILTGKIDLLTGKDGKLEVLDFKTQAKPEKGDPIVDRYFKQLCVYAHILKERYGKHPERLYIYWTPEEKRKDALMEFSFNNDDIRNSGKHFDDVVAQIQKKEFNVKAPPDTTKVCKQCDFRSYCAKEGTIIFKSKELKI